MEQFNYTVGVPTLLVYSHNKIQFIALIKLKYISNFMLLYIPPIPRIVWWDGYRIVYTLDYISADPLIYIKMCRLWN